MAKVAQTSVVVRTNSPEAASRTPAELVIAWARDTASGLPRYIGEIDANHRGAKCECECPSCGLPLIAVNAAKAVFLRRPHFRHPGGAQRDDCAILTARFAALRLLTEDGFIDLPRRRMASQVIGLSGAGHEAWAESPPRKVRVSQMDFQDRTLAVLTFDDGRKLRVALTGSIKEDAGTSNRTLIPTITIHVDDSLAGLDAATIRGRLELVPDAVCWRSHWDDDQLRADAQSKAIALAVDELDWPAEDVELPPGLSSELRRETLLHYEVKRILESAGQIAVPGFEIVEELRAAGMDTLRREHKRDVSILELRNTRLEQRVGQTIPDVVTEVCADGGQAVVPLLIEVTVTNHIGEERQRRIEGLEMAALEIDLSISGGRVTRAGLHDLVIHDVALKRWIAHPEMERLRLELQTELQKEMDFRKEMVRLKEERQAKVMAEPLTDVTRRYLAAAEHLFVTSSCSTPLECKLEAEAARQAIAASVEEMKWRGFPEAGSEDLLGDHRILSGILSIKRDIGIGYRNRFGFEVLKAIRQSGDTYASEWTFYLIAAKVYKRSLKGDQQDWLEEWRQQVKKAIDSDDFTVMRGDLYDRLLSALFPEMARALAKPFGKRPNSADQQPSQYPAALLSRQTSGEIPVRGQTDSDLSSWLLRGADLAAWKKANPEYAQEWEPLLERYRRS